MCACVRVCVRACACVCARVRACTCMRASCVSACLSQVNDGLHTYRPAQGSAGRPGGVPGPVLGAGAGPGQDCPDASQSETASPRAAMEMSEQDRLRRAEEFRQASPDPARRAGLCSGSRGRLERRQAGTWSLIPKGVRGRRHGPLPLGRGNRREARVCGPVARSGWLSDTTRACVEGRKRARAVRKGRMAQAASGGAAGRRGGGGGLACLPCLLASLSIRSESATGAALPRVCGGTPRRWPVCLTRVWRRAAAAKTGGGGVGREDRSCSVTLFRVFLLKPKASL